MSVYEFRLFVDPSQTPAPGAWEAAIARTKLPFVLRGQVDLATHDGPLACEYLRLPAKVFLWRAASSATLAAGAPVTARQSICLRFAHEGDMRDVLGAMTAAATLAMVWPGVLLAATSGRVLAPDRAIDEVRDMAITHELTP
ncbi:MAG: hypothetical protein IT378_22140 [Sandaracinaceae bacterium]|nr:hypothetical protein [Sandaracinaceae bacterium]